MRNHAVGNLYDLTYINKRKSTIKGMTRIDVSIFYSWKIFPTNKVISEFK